MKRVRIVLVAALMALSLGTVGIAPALASENQQDGYHYYGGDADQYGNGHWVDDDCGAPATKKFTAYFYNSATWVAPYTRICHNELDMACNNCVPANAPWEAKPPCITCGWTHDRLNDRTTRIQVTYVPPNKCIRVWEDVNPQYPDDNYILRHGGGEFKGLGFYYADVDFVNDWISAVTLVAC